jgi:peptide deformylase
MSSEEIVLYNTEEEVKTKTASKITTFELVPPDHPALYKVLPEFDFVNPPIDANYLASGLVETCRKQNGIGLSSNQCGLEYRVFVMGAGDEYVAYFNPKILSTSGEKHMEEGCLSFPFLNLNITRPEQVEIEYQDFTGVKHTKTFTGISARCFLHELDHLNGIVYTSRVKPLALQFGLKKLDKIRRKYFNPKKMSKLLSKK